MPIVVVSDNDETQYDVTLQPGDPAIGKFDEKGKIIWPAVDVLGKPYNRVGAAMRGITDDNKQFVIIPAMHDHRINIVPPSVAAMTEPPVPEMGSVRIGDTDVPIKKGRG